MPNWRDINTAPKDDKWVFLKGGQILDGDEKFYPPMVVACFDNETNEWRYTSYDSGFYGLYYNPTHWAEIE